MKIPSHVGIIMDGNRRYARNLALDPWKGHKQGAKKLEKILSWCSELGIKELTLYTFSVQNFQRPKAEVNYLFKLFRDNYHKLKKDERIYKNKIRIRVIGRIRMFPEDIQVMIKDIMKRTEKHDNFTINFAMAYGGREEIVDAARKIGQEVKAGKLNPKDINEEKFSGYLYLSDEPDLVIRTGGERRTSNFLIWQTNYSEWIFLDKMFPKLEKEDFEACIKEFSNRKRRFGK